MLKEIASISKTISDSDEVGIDKLQPQRLKLQNELIDLRKKKMELSREVLSSPEMKQVMQINSDKIKALDVKISDLVNDIQLKKKQTAEVVSDGK